MKLSAVLRATLALTKIRALNFSKQHTRELPGGVLDPQMESLMALFTLEGEAVPLEQKTVRQARADNIISMVLYRKFSPPVASIPNVWNGTVAGSAGDIRVRFYMPAGDGPFPIFVFFHGGGWVVGNLDTSDNLARTICHYGKMSVISVDYRLAPENKFPAGLEDCFTVLQWAADPTNATTIRGDVQKIVVGGDSAGGNLSAAVCLKAKQANSPRIAHQFLIYPATNLRDLETSSYKRHADFPLLKGSDVPWYIQHYTQQPEDTANPLASPALAEDLSNLPPATILTAEFDVLCDDGEHYANLLRQAGVKVNLIRANGLPHGFASLREMVKRADWILKNALTALHQQL